MPLGRDRGVQVGQCRLVVEPGALGHEPLDELKHATGTVDEAAEDLSCIGVDGAVATFVKQPLCSRCGLGRRQVKKCQEITRLVVGAGFFELCSPLRIDQGGGDIRKGVGRISSRGMALGFDKDRPTGFKPAQRVVETAGNSNKLCRHRAIEVGSSKLCRALEGPVLVQDDPLIDKGRPRQKIRKTGIGTTVFGKIHHGRPHELR